MSIKILVADDSLTIQKVIGITLSNTGYTLEKALSSEELTTKVQNEKYDLVLLDYNLSEKMSGEELAKEIKQMSKDCSVLVMLGTFDKVEESTLLDYGIDDLIVKPFEGPKLIQKCKNILDSKSLSDTNSNLDEWSVGNSEESSTEVSSKNEIWDVEIPEIIGESSEPSIMELPPVILKSESSNISTENEIEETILPNNSDLDYPDMSSVGKPLEKFPEPRKTPAFVSLSELEMETGTSSLSLEKDIDPEEIERKSLEIEKDLESEISNDDSWEADNNLSFTATKEDENQITLSKDQEDLRPTIEMIVREICTETVEKVAWKVIPELAEKLIREEIEQITKGLGVK